MLNIVYFTGPVLDRMSVKHSTVFIKTACKIKSKDCVRKKDLGGGTEGVRETHEKRSCLNTQFKNLFQLLSIPKCLVMVSTFSLPHDRYNTDKVVRNGNASTACSPVKDYCNKESLVFCNQKLPRKHKIF